MSAQKSAIWRVGISATTLAVSESRVEHHLVLERVRCAHANDLPTRHGQERAFIYQALLIWGLIVRGNPVDVVDGDPDEILAEVHLTRELETVKVPRKVGII